MKYSTPELVRLGAAAALVQGLTGGEDDDADPLNEHPMEGVALGLDD